MAWVKDIRSGKTEEVSDQRLQEIADDPNFRAVVVDADGQVGTIPIGNISTGGAIGAGMRFASGAEVEDQKLEQEFGQGVVSGVQAGAEGLVRGATAGLSDPALIALGATPQGIKERRERNEVISTGAEALGIIAPIVLTAGGSAPAQIAARGTLGATRAALMASPTAFIARSGRAAEMGLHSLLGTSTQARLAASTLAGAGEAAAFGAGMAISEAALDDTDLTAERLLAHMKTGALLGGAGAGLLTAGGSVLAASSRGTRRLFGEGVRKFRPKSEIELKLQKDPVKATLEIEQDIGKLETVLKKDPTRVILEQEAGAIDTIQGMKGKLSDYVDWHRAVKELSDVQEAGRRSVSDDVSRLEFIWDIVNGRLTIKKKMDAIRNAFKVADDRAENAMIIDSFDDVITKLKANVDDVVRDVDGIYKGTQGDPVPRLKRRVKGFMDETHLKIRKAKVEGATDDQVVDIINDIDRLKQRVGNTRRQIGRRSVVSEPLEENYREMQRVLENRELLGRTIVDEVQGPDNLAWTKWFDSRESYEEFILRMRGGPRSQARELGFESVPIANPDKVGPTLKRANEGDYHLAGKALRENVVATTELMEQLLKSHGGSKQVQKLVVEARDISDRIIENMGTAAKTADDARAFRELIENAEAVGVPGYAKALKTTISLAEGATRLTQKQTGGKIRTALAEAGGDVTATVSAVDRATGLQRLVELATRAAKQTQKAARGFFKAADTAAKEGRRMGTKIIQVEQPEPISQLYDRKIEDHKQWVNNPAAVSSRITRAVGGAGVVSPQIAMSISNGAVRAATFLQSKIPEPVTRPSDIFAHLEKRQRVSDSEMAKYLRYARAVEDPISVIKDFGKGTVTREAAEALRVVYPKMFAELEMQITEGITERKKPLSYEGSISLSILLDRPLHPSMEPKFIARAQMVHAEGREGRQTPPRRTVPNFARNEATEAQKASA